MVERGAAAAAPGSAAAAAFPGQWVVGIGGCGGGTTYIPCDWIDVAVCALVVTVLVITRDMWVDRFAGYRTTLTEVFAPGNSSTFRF